MAILLYLWLFVRLKKCGSKRNGERMNDSARNKAIRKAQREIIDFLSDPRKLIQSKKVLDEKEEIILGKVWSAALREAEEMFLDCYHKEYDGKEGFILNLYQNYLKCLREKVNE